MRRVLFICATPVAFGLDTPPAIGLGGIESTNIALSRALARRGWAVTLATRRSGTVERDGVRNIPLGEAAACEADAVVTATLDAAIPDEWPDDAQRVSQYFSHLKREEFFAWHSAVSPWEVDQYLTAF